MDINKYLGIFLFKNKYCSLPGFGTFNLNIAGAKNTMAAIDPANINIEFSPIGSIDDKFANFIATNENISINKASNMIANYCAEIKETLKIGSIFDVTGLGTFRSDAGGKIYFKQEDSINLNNFVVAKPEDKSNEPAKVAKEVERPVEMSYTNELKSSKAGNKNALKFIVPILVIAVLGAVGYFAYNYIKNNPDLGTDKTEAVIDSTQTETTMPMQDSLSASGLAGNDTTIQQQDTAAQKTDTINRQSASSHGADIKVVIFTYNDQLAADQKSKRLNSFGHNTSVMRADSSTYYVLLQTATQGKAATAVVDSLRKFFNPSEKFGKVFEVK